MEAQYHAGRFAQGSIGGIEQIGALLALHFPLQGPAARELPDQPLLL
jgi:uncharacterized membrane protein